VGTYVYEYGDEEISLECHCTNLWEYVQIYLKYNLMFICFHARLDKLYFDFINVKDNKSGL
jgi:hypothetical protein